MLHSKSAFGDTVCLGNSNPAQDPASKNIKQIISKNRWRIKPILGKNHGCQGRREKNPQCEKLLR